MLKIRLKRIGRKHDPSFRVVVTEVTSPPKGKYKEAVGFYNSALKQLKLNAERIKYWLSVGAQPTASVHNILVKEKIVDAPKRRAHSTRIRKPVVIEEKKVEVVKSESSSPESEESKIDVQESKKQPEEEIREEKKPEDKISENIVDVEENKKEESVEKPKNEVESEARVEESKTEEFVEEKIKKEIEEPKLQP